MAAKKLVAVDFEVFGKVQGVFFRKYTEEQGTKLGLRGWCMNTRHGTVQGQLQGPEGMVKIMKDWLEKTGSPSSRIERAEFKNEKAIEDYTFSGFNIRH
ncbi:acylphosphatase-2-like isoform X2 [Macrobrachium nipponense]|uniref:acylphosphatase-2-like isoform X2 n=1 Tax=Macrobrachium nipponense TaxID=159736 RepID=UPI0030C7CEAE